MSDFQNRLDHDGAGRELTAGDQKKVAVAEITQPFFIDVSTIRKQKATFANSESAKLTRAPGDKGFDVREGQMAFRLRNGNGGVMVALNGLEEGLVKQFGKSRPRLIRDMLSLMIIPLGVVREDANTDTAGPMCTLRVGGTCPGGAPNEYNVPGTEEAFIQEGSGVVFDVPDLVNPMQWGTESTGRPKDQITLVPRAASKTMIATRALNIVSTLIHDPIRFAEALADYEHIANTWVKLGFRMLNSYQVAHCMALNQTLVRPNGTRGSPFIVNPAFTELTGVPADGKPIPGVPPRRAEEVVAAYAELIGVLPEGRVSASLTPAQTQYWAEIKFALKNALLPTPHVDTQAYNAAYSFGFSKRGPNNTIESIALNGDTPRNTPIGALYSKSMVHVNEMLESMADCVYEEQSKTMGVCHIAPNPTGTGIFNYQIIPNGGVGALK